MAGVKGRSGGARSNSGGARPGAGRKPKAKPGAVHAPEHGTQEAPTAPLGHGDRDMLTLLQDIALGRVADATPLQVRAAIAAVQYTHTKKGDGGKKEEAAAKAEKTAQGRFASSPPPLRRVS